MQIPAVDPPPFAPGHVWLVGAGPGDPGLLTLYALDALRRADVIVHDALVDTRILALARKDAVLEPYGKRGGHPSPRQPEITARLIELAQAGNRVVRLKGGDPFVFGRGGEEAMALTAAGVPVRVIPGVTAGLAGLAAAGIAATTRDTNHAVILATGHLAADAPDAAPFWHKLAATGQPLVLYMAMRTLPDIATALMDGGLGGDTPVGVIADATLPTQTVIETTLAAATADIAAARLEAPAIIAIGSIVPLRRHLGLVGSAGEPGADGARSAEEPGLAPPSLSSRAVAT